jgi:hypothetical protein
MIDIHMSWATHRQSKYLLIILVFVGLVFLVMLYPTFTQKPSCSDGKQDGNETGVDCGGSCTRVCSSQAAEPVILWSRAFAVVSTTYNLVAFVENQNKDAAVVQASYEFRAYDENNAVVGRRDGTTFIPPNQQFAIFEPRFDAGGVKVKSVSFQFTSPFVWVKKEPTLQTLPITVDNVIYDNSGATPVLTAVVNNNSIYELPAFDVITILYDQDHNAINASKTQVEGMHSNTQAPITFTWPASFPETPVTKDVLVQIDPFSTTF